MAMMSWANAVDGVDVSVGLGLRGLSTVLAFLAIEVKYRQVISIDYCWKGRVFVALCC